MEVRKLSNGVTNALFIDGVRVRKHKLSKKIYRIKDENGNEFIVPTTKEALGKVKELPNVCTSLIDDMGHLFEKTEHNYSLDHWDTSNVVSMNWTFHKSKYNRPLDHWDTSKVKNMNGMFCCSQYNHPLVYWDTSNVTFMTGMFIDSKYNHPLVLEDKCWDTGKVTDMNYMFEGSNYTYQAPANV